MSMDSQTLLSVCLGLGLSAACGFRIFVPFLLMNVAVRAGYLTVTGNFEWIGSTPALVMFSVATALEVGAYYVPWLDNFLDSIATPTATIAGVIATASVVTGMDPMMKWPLAVIAGGGVAGIIQTTTVAARGLSSLTTAGLGNPLVSTLESGAAIGFTLLAVLVPVIAALCVALLLFLLIRRRRRRRAAHG